MQTAQACWLYNITRQNSLQQNNKKLISSPVASSTKESQGELRGASSGEAEQQAALPSHRQQAALSNQANNQSTPPAKGDLVHVVEGDSDESSEPCNNPFKRWPSSRPACVFSRISLPDKASA